MPTILGKEREFIAEAIFRWPVVASCVAGAGCIVMLRRYAASRTDDVTSAACNGNACSKTAKALPKKEVTAKSISKRPEMTVSTFTSRTAPKYMDVVVIGSGPGGLACAVTLAKQGKKVLVLEQHDRPGGTTHTYTSGGYEFDTGLHYIGGHIWDKAKGCRILTDFVTDSGVDWHKTGDITDVSITNGTRLDLRSDRVKVIEDLKAMFPDESHVIDAHFTVVKTVQAMAGLYFAHKVLPFWLQGLLEFVMRRRYVQRFASKTTLEILQSLGASPSLIARLCYHWGNLGLPPARSSFVAHCMIVDHFLDGAAYPVGGPSVIADAAIKTLQKHGGTILIKAPVERILVNSLGHVTGVRVARSGGIDVLAPVVISTAGALTTYTKLLPEIHRPASIVRELQSITPQSIAHVSLSLGLDGSNAELQLPGANFWISPNDYFDENREAWYNCDDAAEAIAALPLPAVFVTFPSAKDPTWDAQNAGKSTCHILAEAPYDWFLRYQESRVGNRCAEYQSLKDMLTQKMLKVFFEHFPQCQNKVSLCELGTPLTSEHYLASSRGASYGLAVTPERFAAKWLQPRTPIKGLYIAGQDIVSPGVMGALVGGFLTAIAVDLKVALSNFKVVISL